jgi:hypothetical protein
MRTRGKVNTRGIKMTRNTTHLSIVTWNVNGLNALIKRHRIANLVKKNKTQPYVVYKGHISQREIKRVKG